MYTNECHDLLSILQHTAAFIFPFEHLSHHSGTPYQRAIDSFDEYFQLLVLLVLLHRPVLGTSTLVSSLTLVLSRPPSLPAVVSTPYSLLLSTTLRARGWRDGCNE